MTISPAEKVRGLQRDIESACSVGDRFRDRRDGEVIRRLTHLATLEARALYGRGEQVAAAALEVDELVDEFGYAKEFAENDDDLADAQDDWNFAHRLLSGQWSDEAEHHDLGDLAIRVPEIRSRLERAQAEFDRANGEGLDEPWHALTAAARRLASLLGFVARELEHVPQAKSVWQQVRDRWRKA